MSIVSLDRVPTIAKGVDALSTLGTHVLGGDRLHRRRLNYGCRQKRRRHRQWQPAGIALRPVGQPVPVAPAGLHLHADDIRNRRRNHPHSSFRTCSTSSARCGDSAARKAAMGRIDKTR
jgi:hypothetical protein